jgi:ERCC4-related helicase
LSSDARADTQWSTKRVFYATPQTFLIDMAKGRLDPADIVLVIVGKSVGLSTSLSRFGLR